MDKLPIDIISTIVELLAETKENAIWKLNAAGISSWGTANLPDYYKPTGVRLSLLVTLSRLWQQAVERETFKRIRVHSTELDHFRRLFASPSRRHALIQLNYVIELPAYADEAKKRFERDADRQTNNECFTAALKNLFQILSEWEDNHTRPGAVEFRIRRIASVSDLPVRTCPDDDDKDNLGNDRFRFSYLELTEPENLPVLRMIGHFQVGCASGTCPPSQLARNLSNSAVLHLASKFPCVRICWMNLDDDSVYPVLQRKQRRELTHALHHVFPVSALDLTELILMFPFDQTRHPGRLLDFTERSTDVGDDNEDNNIDPLGNAIYHAITTGCPALRDLVLMGTFGPAVFGPGPAETVRMPFWRNLRNIEVIFNMTTPSGHWYFAGQHWGDHMVYNSLGHGIPEDAVPPGYSPEEQQEGDTDSAAEVFDEMSTFFGGLSPPANCAYSYPVDEELVPFLEGFARACGQVLFLETAYILCKSVITLTKDKKRFEHLRSFGIWIMAPGAQLMPHRIPKQDELFHQYLDRRRLYWGTKEWHPSKELRELFRAIGRQAYGDDLIERDVKT